MTWLRPGDPSPSACSLLGSARSLTGLPGGLDRSGKRAPCQRPDQALRHVPWRLITQRPPTRSSGLPLLGLLFLSRHPSGPGGHQEQEGTWGHRAPRGWLGQPREPPPSSLLNKASRESGSRIGAQEQAPSAGGAAESPRERRGQESRSLTENNLGSSFFLLFNSLIGQTGKLRSRGRKGRAGATPEEYSRPFSWRSRSPFLHPE